MIKKIVVFDHVQKSYDGEISILKDLNLNIVKADFYFFQRHVPMEV
jgi:ABC-type ATPase involved in cell division